MKIKYIVVALAAAMFIGCGGGEKKAEEVPAEETPAVEEVVENEGDQDFMANKGIGPISHVELGPIDEALAAEGKEIFKTMCSACHKISKRVVGPKLKGITTRRSPEWIMNMMLNPEEMVEKDPDAKKLFEEYLSPMSNQNLKEEEARAILEYFRTK